jgi:hypothetical protein
MAGNEELVEQARHTLLEVLRDSPDISPPQTVAAVIRREPALNPALVRREAWTLIGQRKIEFTAEGRLRLL